MAAASLKQQSNRERGNHTPELRSNPLSRVFEDKKKSNPVALKTACSIHAAQKTCAPRYRSGRSSDWLKFKNPAGTRGSA